MISSRKLSCKCSLQIASRLATACTELGPLSVMYRTITTAVAAAGPGAWRTFRLRTIARLRLVLLSGICRPIRSVALFQGSARPGRHASGQIRSAHPAQRFLPVARGPHARLIVVEVRRQFTALPLQIMLQDLDPRTRVRLGKLQRHPLLIELRAALYRLGSL